jgi:L-threonylcarbamoyladenylate synthase
MKFSLDNFDANNIVGMIKSGVGVIPTDTVYGLAASVYDVESVNRLYSLKNRDKKPGTIIAADVNQLRDLGVDDKYLSVAMQFWPGSVSVIIPVCEDLDYLHQGIGSLAFRVVADENISKILGLAGPLLTSSANHPGRPVANTIDEARDYFGNRVDFYVDGGNLSARLPSSIIKIVDDEIIIVRPG